MRQKIFDNPIVQELSDNLFFGNIKESAVDFREKVDEKNEESISEISYNLDDERFGYSIGKRTNGSFAVHVSKSGLIYRKNNSKASKNYEINEPVDLLLLKKIDYNPLRKIVRESVKITGGKGSAIISEYSELSNIWVPRENGLSISAALDRYRFGEFRYSSNEEDENCNKIYFSPNEDVTKKDGKLEILFVFQNEKPITAKN